MEEGAFDDWIGRSIETSDLVTAGPVRRLAATLDHDGAHWPRDALPPLGHWLFNLPDAPRAALGRDGHPALGTFLPPIAQPRRMWAGGRVRFIALIAIGANLVRRTTILAVATKQGSAGGMTLLTLRHELIADGTLAVDEEQDLVYLPVTAPAPPRAVDRPPPETTRAMTADEALLFRFSALTFNSHRIHYDLPYTREVEHYPALVVHGPLQAMLLADFAGSDGLQLKQFDYRGRAPLYAPGRFTLARAGHELWVANADGQVTMTATVA